MANLYTWIDGLGQEHNLYNPPTVFVGVGIAGLGIPEVVAVEDTVPYQAGTLERYSTLGGRTIDLPLNMMAANQDALDALVLQIIDWFNPLKGTGKLRITKPNGVAIEANCAYRSGLQIQKVQPNYGTEHARMVITLRGVDPFFYDKEPQVKVFQVPTATPFFTDFPIELTPEVVFSAPNDISNNGNVDAWPVWRIEGPGTFLRLQNQTTGKKIELATNIVEGQTVIIDTRQGLRSVYDEVTGESFFPSVSLDSELWPLGLGTTSILVEYSGVTSASKVTMTYYQRYLAGL